MARAKSTRRKKKSKSTAARSRRHPSEKSILSGLKRTVANNPDSVEARLSLGEFYLGIQNDSELIEISDSLQARRPFENDLSEYRYLRLKAYGLAYTGRLVDADEVAQDGVKLFGDSPDFLFVLSFVCLSLREYDRAVEVGEKYLAALSNFAQRTDWPAVFAITDQHRAQLLNFIGSAYLETGQFNKAQSALEAAISSDPGNSLPYINLVSVHRQTGDFDKARKTVAEGLTSARDSQELRLLERTVAERATISACMIVKNEEELLPGCLDSIRDWVDEIVIVDTGSTDRTVEIAESYGARIYHQPWEGNFSKHRNYSVELATSEWVFIIDADERIEPEGLPVIRDMTNRDDVSIISIDVYNVYGKERERITFLPSVRFWRRDLNLRYEGIVHNLLDLGAEHPVVRAAIRLQHLGYDLSPEKMKQKFERSKALLERQLEDDPDNAFAHFNYAQLLKTQDGEYAVHDIPTILKAANRGVELTDPDDKRTRHIHLMCLDQLAWAYFYDTQYDKAMECCQRALRAKPDYLDPLFLVGHIHSSLEQWDQAKVAYHKYLEVQAKYDPTGQTDCMILGCIDSRSSAFYSLATIAELQEAPELAVDYYQRTLQLHDGYLEAYGRLGRLQLNRGNIRQAETSFRSQLESSNQTVEASLGLAGILQNDRKFDEAEKFYRLAMQLDSLDAVSPTRLGRMLLEINRDQEAFDLLQQATDLDGGTEPFLLALAQTYFAASHFQRAAQAYQRLLDTYGANGTIQNDLGNCYFKMKQFDQAEAMYRQLIEQGEPVAEAYRNLGLTQVSLEKAEEAIISLTKYLEIREDYEVVRILADLYLHQRDFEAARDYYERFLVTTPTDTVALFRLSECYLYMGHTDAAIIGYRRVLETNPDAEPARARLAELQSKAEPV